MIVTTPEWWSVIGADGVEYPLATLAKNIESWGNERQQPVPLRGADTRVPWVPGEQETPRIADARTMPLAMWVRGCNDDGEVPIGSSAREEFNHNWRTLQRILHNEGKIFTLRKRFYDESRTLRIASARARYADGLSPAMIGQTGAKFTVDLRLADPYFYGDPENIDLDTGVGNVDLYVIGDASTRKVTLEGSYGVGGASDISLASDLSGHSFTLPFTGDPDQIFSIDMANESARVDTVNYSGLVNHSGSTNWFMLAPGTNVITPSADTGGWTGTLTYYPTWN